MKTLLLSCFMFFAALLGIRAQTEIKLDSLMFTENWFSDIEAAKASPDKVWFLDLALRKLKTFPPEILTFTNVKRLYLSVNYWPTVPEEIGNLKALEILDLSSNYYLNKLPDGLKNCTSLKELILKDNKLNAGEADRIKSLMPNVKVTLK